MNFTFKTIKPTGKFKSFDNSEHLVKIKGFQVGAIDDKTPHKIRLTVIKSDINEDNCPNCIWKWITLKNEFENIDQAKEFLNKNFKAITEKFNLHKFEK